MTSKHTPGPWLVKADGVDVGPDDGFIPFDGCGCCGSPWMEGADDATQMANARLIAAAPTYYEAGVEFRAYESSLAAGDDVMAMQHYARASQLIAEAHAKATGAQP